MNRAGFITLGLLGSAYCLSARSYDTISTFGSRWGADDLTGKSSIELYGESICQLREQPARAFRAMYEQAARDGVSLTSISSYRSYDAQLRIWNNKYTRFTKEDTTQDAISRIIEYSTIPGTSRHHWGTEVDIIDPSVHVEGDRLLEEHYDVGGAYHTLKQWLDSHAEYFGFYEVYTNSPTRRGFKYEPWHFSYKAFSVPMLEQYLELDFVSLIRSEALKGSTYLTEEFLATYLRDNLLDINPILIPS